jgi:hypothetical protein
VTIHTRIADKQAIFNNLQRLRLVRFREVHRGGENLLQTHSAAGPHSGLGNPLRGPMYKIPQHPLIL